MRCREFFLTILPVLACIPVSAQSGQGGDVPFDKAHFTDPAALKQALSAIKRGDELAYKGGLDLAEAIASYAEAEKVNPDNAELEAKMGTCALNGPMPTTAVNRLERAATLNPSLRRIHFLLGYAYQLNARWDEAIAQYKLHGDAIRMNPDPDRTFNMVDKHIAECNYGKNYMAHPVNATVTNAGPQVNSERGEYGALQDPAGKMYFTSRRATTTGGKVNKVNGDYFEDIYSSTWKADGWTPPVTLPSPVNSARNDATVSMSPDGGSMIIYRDETNGGDLYESHRQGDGWSTPTPFPPEIDGPAQESSAYRTADGEWLYFVSSREGGLGGADIYRSRWDTTTATWSAAENLGPTINTPYDEDGIFITADGRTMYFASQGHTTMGGYDLFKSTMSNGTWSRPENLGWPINSPGDDQFLVLSADGKSGYFNSVRAGGKGGDDIYRVDFTQGQGVDGRVELASAGKGLPMSDEEQKLRLIGFIKGLKLMDPVEARVEVMDLKDTSVIAYAESDPATGKFSLEIPEGGDYALHVTAKGYLPHSEKVKAGGDGEVQRDVDLHETATGATEVMGNITFAPDRSDIQASSSADLAKLVQFLLANPSLRIEVGGHTDSDNGPEGNQQLSEDRAKAVVDHLVAHGVDAGRLVAKGYGDSQPLVPNDSAAHKAMNRRTEIKVL